MNDFFTLAGRRVAVSGHQPHLLGGFSDDVADRLLGVARGAISAMAPAEIISGMAAGWDIAMAQAAAEVGVPFVAALAYPGQGADWPDEAKRQLNRLLERASTVHACFPCRTQGMWTQRDHWVVDRSEAVAALWSGATGGTERALDYAGRLGRPITNFWDDWERSGSLMRAVL